MSRIGRIPVAVPSKVEVLIEGSRVRAKGPQGELAMTLPPGVRVEMQGGYVSLTSDRGAGREAGAIFGTSRALVANLLRGVDQGFVKVLDVVGLGFKAQLSGPKLVLSLGKSHPVEFSVPPGVKAAVDPKATRITLTGASKELVGATAAALRALKPPEPYKGTGIRYEGEHIFRKAGKTAAGVGAGAGVGGKK